MAEVRYTATASFDVRGQLKRAMRQFCWQQGWPLEIEEDKGWLSSVLLFRMTVPDEEARDAARTVNTWLREMSR